MSRTTFNDQSFKKKIMETLFETQAQYFEHTWVQAQYAVENHDGSDGLPMHNVGILGGAVPVDTPLLRWWCKNSANHGYGIFHLAKQVTGVPVSFTLVCFNISFIEHINTFFLSLDCPIRTHPICANIPARSVWSRSHGIFWIH